MKIVRVRAFGGPEVLVVEDAPTPAPGPGQVLIRVESASVNFADVMRRRNDLYPFPTSLPYTPAAVARTPGDPRTARREQRRSRRDRRRRCHRGPYPDRGRAAASRRDRPHRGRRPPGGGPRAHGADHVVDYTRPDWTDQVRRLTDSRGVDLVLEITGGETFGQALSVLAPFGRVVPGMAGGQPLLLDPEAIRSFFYAPALNQSLRVFNVGLYFGMRPQAAAAALRTLVGQVATGQVKVSVGHVLPLARASEAHRRLETRQSTGKIILKPWA